MSHLYQLHDAAHLYLQRGWSVIPVRDKTPAIARWKPFQNHRPSPVQLDRWFSREQVTGIGLICGSVSGGLTIRDYDQPESYRAWTQAYPQLAKLLPTVQTGRGFHVYCRSTLSSIRHFSDGELRASGYCLAAPSLHPNGHEYELIVALPDGDLPLIDPADCGLAELVCETERAEDCRRIVERAEVMGCGGRFSVLDVQAEIEQATASTQPTDEGQRNRMLFELARALKAIPALADAPVKNLRGIVAEWHRRAEPNISTRAFEDSWADFVRGWPKVRFPRGANPMTQILEKADAAPDPPLVDGYQADTLRLIRLCRELQRTAGSGPFFLAGRTVAELLDMDPVTAWRRLTALEADGILDVVERGTRTKANRYRYLLPE